MTCIEAKDSAQEFLCLTLNGATHKIPYASLRMTENFEAICGALYHESLDIVVGASIVLGQLQDERALPHLLHAFLTTGSRKAQAVSWALGEIGNPSALPFLTEALSSNFVPKSAIIALGKIGSPTSLDILVSFLVDSDESVRALAARSLGQIKFGDDFALMKKAMAALKMQLRVETARAVKLVICAVSGRFQRALDQGLAKSV